MKLLSLRFGLGAVAGLLCGVGAWAQIRTDGSVGPAAQALAGPAFLIPQTLGRVAGGNLFHSFSTFNIGSGESATFTTSTAGINHVISRVTGGSPSVIAGTLRLTAFDGAPDFYFINPAGVTFGKGAAIDVPGAFRVGTADYVKLGDGRFYADATKASSFSSAPPEAFGFLGGSRAAVTLQDGATLVTRRTHGVAIAAGDIGIDNAAIGAGAAEIRLVAVGGDAVEVGFSGALPAGSGTLDLGNGGSVTSFALGGQAGGRIAVSAGEVAIDNAAYLYSTHDNDTVSGGAAGGDITLAVRNGLAITNGASISTDANGAGRAGQIRVDAGSVRLDSAGYINSTALVGSSGAAGAVALATSGDIQITGGASVSSSAYGLGAAQPLRIDAANLRIDGGHVLTEGTAGSAAVSVTASGTVSLANAGFIVTSTTGAGDAGALRVQSHDLSLESKANIGSIAIDATGGSGSVDINAASTVALAGESKLYSFSSSAGNAGNVSVTSGTLSLSTSSINSNAASSSADAGAPMGIAASGNIAVTVTGVLKLNEGSSINTSTLTHGAGGNVLVRAHDIALDGNSSVTSAALAGRGNAGTVHIAASGQLAMHGESFVSTGTNTAGDGGVLQVEAGSMLLDGASNIDSTTGPASAGRGGGITVKVDGALQLRDGAHISATTSGTGNAGDVQVNVGSLSMDRSSSLSSASGKGSTGEAGGVTVVARGDVSFDHGSFITSDAFGSGNAGNISVSGRNITLDNGSSIRSDAFLESKGNAGRIDIQATGDVALLSTAGPQALAATIATNAYATGDAGSVNVRAANLRMDSQEGIVSMAQAGTGNAGNIDVSTTGDITITRGTISTSTRTSGNGGLVKIRAANITLDGVGASVLNAGLSGSSGRGGDIDIVAAGNLLIHNGGITSTTAGAGAAGSVKVQAARLFIDGADAGISAAATPGSSGQTGDLQVLASERITLVNGGYISIANGASVADPATRRPTTLQAAAPDFTLRQGTITGASFGNVAASDIVVDVGHSLVLVRSAISTSANAGNGGAITVRGGDALVLRQSAITTSVLGLAGNGGDIDIATRALALQSGFIQANTAARDASGGLVRIAADSLVASSNTLFLGGNTAYAVNPDLPGFNVIQAAAPTGVSGAVDVSSPVLDITGSLRGLRADVIDAGGLGRSPCQASGGSSLALTGRGGLPPSARGLLRAERPLVQGQTGAAPAVGGAPVFALRPRHESRGCW